MKTNAGQYADGRTFPLPDGWASARPEVLDTARAQTLQALDLDRCVDRLSAYYDRESAYAGTLFLDVEPNNPDLVEPSDLYAVTTLSMDLDPRHGRLLLDAGDVREGVRRELRGIPANLPIEHLDAAPLGAAETLQRTWELHLRLRGLLGENSSWRVFAAKLSARKRPYLIPVRDNLVCEHLAGGRPLRRDSGWPGDFSIDMQVYAYLMTDSTIRRALADVGRAHTERRVRADSIELRLLDAALWTAAGRRPRTVDESQPS